MFFNRALMAGVVASALFLTACGYAPTETVAPAGSFRLESCELVSANAPESVRCAFVTDAFARAVKPQPLIGRSFLPDEYRAGRSSVVLLSYAVWQRRFESDPTVVGRTVRLGGKDLTIVGVLPAGFGSPPGAEAWIPEPGA